MTGSLVFKPSDDVCVVGWTDKLHEAPSSRKIPRKDCRKMRFFQKLYFATVSFFICIKIPDSNYNSRYRV